MKRYTLNGFEIVEYDEAVSTNTIAENIPANELKDKQVILTYHQTKGRGLGDNKWESEPGKNISMTVVFKPECLDASAQFAVSMVIALGCYDYISRYVENCSVKWPNDIYAGEQKIGGILINHTISGMYIGSSLCGIGLNINQDKFLSDAPNPVSLRQIIGHDLPLQEVLPDLLGCIAKRYLQIHNYHNLEKDFMNVLYRKKGEYKWQDEAKVFSATISGVDEYGRLILKDKDGLHRIYGFKEVKYL